MPLVGYFDYAVVIAASISALGAVVSACIGGFVLWHVKPPSGGRLSSYVEDNTQTARANNLELRRMNGHGLESSRDTDEDAA